MSWRLRTVRRSILGFIILGTLMLGFGALNPYTDASIISRVLRIAVLAILVAGLTPGSYLHKFVGGVGAEAPERSNFVVILASVVVPILLIVLFLLAALDRVYMFRLVEELDLSFLNSSEIRFYLFEFLSLAFASGTLLVLNSIDLVRARSGDTGA